ncbi:hypothetical protein LQ772_06840 [Frateuria edaphi]|uniref:hypothetical protein n=1 Tax=Frateuria edaphi TaxID=2898793 RepID=UPI001E5ACD2B|nr:hypothetical protein [Frateuria edaphi]UGB47002.1 hypothetical protein LQ772_06840 [Frateuria edaphi]
MSTSTIKEFLVRLGYKVDATGERKFVDGVNNATKVVNGLGTALKVLAAGGAAAGAMAWFGKMANSLEGLYYSSQRAGASAKNLQAFGYAAAQMGSSVEEAQSTVQGFRQWMLNNPGSEMWLRGLGVGTRDARGKLRDTTELLQDLGQKFAQMPTYRANQYAQLLGIPLKLRLALQEGMGGYIADYRKMLAEAGLDSDKAAKRSHEFLTQVRGLGGAFQVLGLKIASALMGSGGGGGALNRFRHLLLTHSEQITRVVGRLADFLLTLFERLLNWLDRIDWDKLDRGMGKLFGRAGQIAGSFDQWKTAALALGAVLAASVLAPVLSIVAGVGRLIPLLGTAAGGLQALGVAGAAVGGWKLGQLIDQHTGFSQSGAGHATGRAIASVLAMFGNSDAQAAIDLEDYNSHDPTWRKNWLAAYRKWSDADKANFGKEHPEFLRLMQQAMPLGVRNNNPGNLRTGAGGTFGRYGSAQQGLNALGRQLRSYYNGTSAAAGHKRLRTLHDIISTYAPSSENNTGAYIGALAKQLGVGADTPLNRNDPAQLSALMRGIVQHENGVNPYSAEMFRAAASSVGQASKGASVHAETNIYVQGGSSPESTAQAVAGKQNSVNQRLYRDFGAAVS